MSATNKEDLKEAYRSEKDSRIRARMLAVHMIRTRKKSIDETAADLMQSERWIHNWLKRYDEGGLDTLRVLPRVFWAILEIVASWSENCKTAQQSLSESITNFVPVVYISMGHSHENRKMGAV